MRHLATLAILLLGALHSAQAAAERKTFGVTLHPYYAYLSNIVADRAEVVPLIDSGFNPHSYRLNPADIARLRELDALVVNGIGHDAFALEAVERLQLDSLTLIQANRDVPLLGKGNKVNPHTFVSIDAAVRQVYSIAKALGEVDPENAKAYRLNAFAYAKRLRRLKLPLQRFLADRDLSGVRIASTHNAYGYLLQEFGLTVSAVVEPAHGVQPTASQLQKTVDTIRQANIDVLFTELNMKNSYVETIEQETGIRVYHFSHMTHGDYRADMIEAEMGLNLRKLEEALRDALEAGDA